MRIALGCDHAGFPLKAHVRDVLEAHGAEVTDHGTHSADPVDFPDVAGVVCDAVTGGSADRGLLVCGTGVGAAIAANKHPGIRATVCHEPYSARQGVEHDDVNVLCVGAWIIGPAVAADVVRAFLGAQFASDDPDFVRRVAKLHALERSAGQLRQ